MESPATVQDLFKRWRNDGDAQAGMEMAQKFSDWYYAITAARLGDRAGRQPLEAACQAFEQGIVQVTRTSDLVDWAHGLVDRAAQGAGSRLSGGDFPNGLTGNRSPTALLQAVRGRLSPEQAELLARTFDAGTSLETLASQAEQAGGMPHAILEARYALKRALRDQAQVPLQVVPERPNLDLAPLPLYEAARMETQGEEASFEKWLISDIELCKDVAEFATFAHALRAGAFAGAHPAGSSQPRPTAPAAAPASAPAATPGPAAARPATPATPAAPPAPAPDAGSPPAPRSMVPLLIGLGLLFVIVVLLGVVAILALS
ncbi:hypothetical protein L6R53_29205 [Myxococcota bacterium]|nr:hypothetical protein [Myxococcota bacterium]